ncbi:MAG: AraC family transcriptional regulator [Clostridia bacterium]|nr:AraC family transcriptional regulator [Clostridia bacterium]
MDKSLIEEPNCFSYKKQIPIRLADGEGFIAFTHVRSTLNVGHLYGPFSPNVCELYMHIDGTCNILIDDRIYSPHPGDLFLYPPQQIHSFVPTSAVQERLYIFFTPNAFDSIVCEPPILSLFQAPEASRHHLVFPQAFSKSIMEKLMRISREVQSDTPDTPYLIYGNTLRILLAIKQLLAHATSTSLASDCPAPLPAIVNHIHTSYRTIHSVQQLCAHFGISRSHLTRLFTAHIGTTPYGYLQSFKLNHAKQLLSRGASVTEACFDSGFSDYSNFIQLFRKQVGLSPLTYKKQQYGNGAFPADSPYKIE